MFSTKKLQLSQALIAIIALKLLAISQARIIRDCSAISSQTAEYINNPNTTCNSQYPFIYCNSSSSAYCTQEQCEEDYECAGQSESTVTPASSITTPPLLTITPATPPSSALNTTTAINIRTTCQVGVTGNYRYPGNCRYYYRCVNGYHSLQDCGFRMSFDEVDGYCKNTRVARCSQEIRSVRF